MIREVMLGGEEVADALLELLQLQLEVAVDLLSTLGQERWHALHKLLQEERLLHCVLKVFALESFRCTAESGQRA